MTRPWPLSGILVVGLGWSGFATQEPSTVESSTRNVPGAVVKRGRCPLGKKPAGYLNSLTAASNQPSSAVRNGR